MKRYRVTYVHDVDPWYFPYVIGGFAVTAAVFAVWRSAVVNWAVWYGPLSYAAEMLSLIMTVMFVISLRYSVEPVPPPATASDPAARGAVDLLIPTVNEPVAVLEATVLGALRVRGVREVLVLDDGARAEVRALASRLGVRYLARARRDGAKAGNLNHGLAHSDAEFVVTLDADHIPLPGLVEEMAGYFADPGVGWVQSPQTFYNTGSYTFRPRGGRASAWNEQEMFYGGVQPAKAASNSAIYTGTSAMLRRAALDEIGGFATGTPTEDIHTSIRLHAKGWQSVYVPRTLACGLEVENLQEYFRTRRRWAVGALHLLLRHRDSPLRLRGLSGWQRLNYLTSLTTHLRGLIRAVFVVVSFAVLLTGTPPVRGAYSLYGFAFVAFTLLSIGAAVALGRGHYHLVHTDVFGIADCLAQLSGLAGFARREQTFEVTRKRASRLAGTRLKVAYLAFGLVNAVGVAIAVAHLLAGRDVAMSAWTGGFLAVTTLYATAFTVMTIQYERRPADAGLQALGGEDLYRHVLAFAGAHPAPATTTR